MGSSAYLSPIEAAPEGGRILQAAMADFDAAGRGGVLPIREPVPSTISGGLELRRGSPPPAGPPPRDYGPGALERRHGENRRR